MANNEKPENEVNYLNSTVEKIVFNKEGLNDLKNKIEAYSISNEKNTSKELKQQIVNYLMSIYNNLLKFLPYYVKFPSSPQVANSYNSGPSGDTNDVKKLKAELLEKDKFLEEIGTIVDTMYEKVEKKPVN